MSLGYSSRPWPTGRGRTRDQSVCGQAGKQSCGIATSMEPLTGRRPIRTKPWQTAPRFLDSQVLAWSLLALGASLRAKMTEHQMPSDPASHISFFGRRSVQRPADGDGGTEVSEALAETESKEPAGLDREEQDAACSRLS